MSFVFGFNSDNIDVDQEEDDQQNANAYYQSDTDALKSKPTAVTLQPPQLHPLDELLSTLPSHLTFSTYPLYPSPLTSSSPPTVTTSPSTSSPSQPSSNPAPPNPLLPRRDLSDIRAQLLSESDLSPTSTALTDGLTTNDIKAGLYEGGFKTWECSVDLARYLGGKIRRGELVLGEEGERGVGRVVELGAGTALPASLLLSHLFSSHTPISPPSITSTLDSPSTTSATSSTFLIADYNLPVLTHASIPNLLLTTLRTSSVQHLQEPQESQDEGFLPTTADTIQTFRSHLQARDVRVCGVSGGWGREFVELAHKALSEEDRKAKSKGDGDGDDGQRGIEKGKEKSGMLVLASETIYSPESLEPFVDTLLGLLVDRSREDGTAGGTGRGEMRKEDIDEGSANIALVAAKKMYFGVGGGVDEFVAMVQKRGAVVRKVWDSEEEEDLGEGRGGKKGSGVGRCILEVRLGRE